MTRKFLICRLVIIFLITIALAEAQQPAGKIWRIGFLTTASASDPGTVLRLEAFRQALRDLGYVEGKNINVEYRYAEGRLDRLAELAEGLVRLKVDILIVSNSTVARATTKSIGTIPMVVATFGDLSGLVASLARPGGNITGLTNYSPELFGKRLGLLKEVVPKVSRFAFLNGADGAAAKSEFEDHGKATAKALRVQVQYVELKALNPDLDGAFRVIAKERIGALITSSSPSTSIHRKRIVELVEQKRIPAIHPDQQWAIDGGLMSYGADLLDNYRRVAWYVDKILKGAKPADLPVQQPMKFEFVINLKTAKALNLTVPQSVLFRADKVIR